MLYLKIQRFGAFSLKIQCFGAFSLKIQCFGAFSGVRGDCHEYLPSTYLPSSSQIMKNRLKISSFLGYLSNEAESSPGTHPYPPIARVGGTHGTIPRARSVLRSGDLGFGVTPRERDIARDSVGKKKQSLRLVPF